MPVLSILYGYIVIAFVSLVIFGDLFLARLIGAAALLMACYEIGKASRSLTKR